MLFPYSAVLVEISTETAYDTRISDFLDNLSLFSKNLVLFSLLTCKFFEEPILFLQEKSELVVPFLLSYSQLIHLSPMHTFSTP